MLFELLFILRRVTRILTLKEYGEIDYKELLMSNQFFQIYNKFEKMIKNDHKFNIFQTSNDLYILNKLNKIKSYVELLSVYKFESFKSSASKRFAFCSFLSRFFLKIVFKSNILDTIFNLLKDINSYKIISFNFEKLNYNSLGCYLMSHDDDSFNSIVFIKYVSIL
jgi:hypothetical protein